MEFTLQSRDGQRKVGAVDVGDGVHQEGCGYDPQPPRICPARGLSFLAATEARPAIAKLFSVSRAMFVNSGSGTLRSALTIASWRRATDSCTVSSLAFST